jgi:hypothetical protein
MPDETPSPDTPPTDVVDDDARLGDAVTDDASDAGGADARDDDPTGTERDDAPPESVVDEAERLTRLARDAVVDEEAEAYRDHRADLLDDYDYSARVREDETRDVLVCHPAAWVAEGTIRTERIDDLDRGIERPLSGPGDAAEWDTIDEHNRDIVADVRAAHGEVHGANAAALADFMGNHYAKPIDDATREELVEFLDEYYPRNAWPTDEERAVVKESVCLVFDVADERCPIERPR